MDRQIRSLTTSKGDEIKYSLVLSQRRSISLSINSVTSQIVVRAPKGVSVSIIEAFVHSKISWINKVLNRIQNTDLSKFECHYNDNSTHLIFGKPFTVKLERRERIRTGESLHTWSDNILRLVVRNDSLKEVRGALRAWYASFAPMVVDKVFNPMLDSFLKRHKCKIKVTVEFKYVKSYWGQCSTNGVIRLNMELFRAPIECIEYIVAHELCHLIHHNHSQKFYDLLSKEMPDWERRKKLLNETVRCRMC